MVSCCHGNRKAGRGHYKLLFLFSDCLSTNVRAISVPPGSLPQSAGASVTAVEVSCLIDSPSAAWKRKDQQPTAPSTWPLTTTLTWLIWLFGSSSIQGGTCSRMLSGTKLIGKQLIKCMYWLHNFTQTKHHYCLLHHPSGPDSANLSTETSAQRPLPLAYTRRVGLLAPLPLPAFSLVLECALCH